MCFPLISKTRRFLENLTTSPSKMKSRSPIVRHCKHNQASVCLSQKSWRLIIKGRGIIFTVHLHLSLRKVINYCAKFTMVQGILHIRQTNLLQLLHSLGPSISCTTLQSIGMIFFASYISLRSWASSLTKYAPCSCKYILHRTQFITFPKSTQLKLRI